MDAHMPPLFLALALIHSVPALEHFYVYRAIEGEFYGLDNANAADAGGVMRYIHSEVSDCHTIMFTSSHISTSGDPEASGTRLQA